MIQRQAKNRLLYLAQTFKSVAVTGSRQSGKTTLIKQVFKDKPYFSLENPDIRRYVMDDPKGFLNANPKGAILDEIQRTPELFSYLQEVLDNSKVKGLFILSGSNNLLLQQSISQTLAGRIAYLNLLPFSISELSKSRAFPKDDNELMIKGFYPPVYDQGIPAQDWAPEYIRTYIERDVRQVKNITDLNVFERFFKLIAGRVGQELNSNSLAAETGVDVKTIQSWIGILATGFIIYLLKPHSKNFKKSIVKRPKIYFYDTSLVCSAIEIRNTDQLMTHPSRGFIFENMVVSELLKNRTNAGLPVNLYYWRDKTGHEVDLIIDNAGKLVPVEIKSGKTLNNEFFKNLNYWCRLSGVKNSTVLYGGKQQQERSTGQEALNWRSAVLSGM